MTGLIDCEMVTVRDPETGEQLQAVVIPDGMTVCLVDAETAERYAEWTECAAVRIEAREDGAGSFQVTTDLEWLTSEEGPQ